jgi:hypothetical protein
VIVAKSITSGLCRAFVEPTSRKTDGLYSHGSGAGAGVLDRCGTLEAGLSPVIHVSLAAHIVSGDTIMWKVDDRIRPAAASQLAGIVGKRLTDALDVV